MEALFFKIWKISAQIILLFHIYKIEITTDECATGYNLFESLLIIVPLFITSAIVLGLLIYLIVAIKDFIARGLYRQFLSLKLWIIEAGGWKRTWVFCSVVFFISIQTVLVHSLNNYSVIGGNFRLSVENKFKNIEWQDYMSKSFISKSFSQLTQATIDKKGCLHISGERWSQISTKIP